MIFGIIFLFLLTFAAFSIWLFMLPIGLLLLFIHFKNILIIRRKILNFLSELFLDYAYFLLTVFCQTKVIIYTNNEIFSHHGHHGHLGHRQEGKYQDIGLIICNHRTRIDWMYAGWCYGAILRINSHLYVILKDSLKSLPIYGWAIQLMHYIFLTRSKEKDLPYIIKSINYLFQVAQSPIIFLFPEGTDLSDSNLQRSHVYSRQNGIKELNQVLYPKSNGFSACLSTMRDRQLLLHDMTVAYIDYNVNKRSSEKSLLNGEFPREVHLFVQVYDIDKDIPREKAELDQWLRERFLYKEALLDEFYRQVKSTGSFEGDRISSKDEVSVASDDVTISIPPRLIYKSPDMTFTVTATGFITAVVTLSLIYSLWFRWIVTYFIIIAVSAKVFQGFDTIELALHSDMILDSSSVDKTKTQDVG